MNSNFFRRITKCSYINKFHLIVIIVLTIFSVSIVFANISDSSGLLFYLSGENGFIPEIAKGEPEPTFIREVEVIRDGAKGKGFQCGHTQLMAYKAPGNIYAERGTLAFFWRSREVVGEVPFPIFRVGYADHSSWDLVWLRIDYNGQGFDAFVTDVNLARQRVSYTIPELPEPDQWIHLALTWDETQGIRFYVDGKLVGQKDTTAVFYAGLDQFGPHSRIISPYQVQSLYNFVRGGDIDEICIFDRMLSSDYIDNLAKGQFPAGLNPVKRKLNSEIIRDEWLLRYGWNRPEDIPPPLESSSVSVRKVEIHNVYDIKQWWWKANDGIRETTWPPVYNRSRILGRNDYFQLPDWNCYSLSGKSVTFTMPDEPWNHLEISGAAFGSMALITYDKEAQINKELFIFDRLSGQERTFHRLDEPAYGGKIRFDNKVQETPIGEFQAYYVKQGKEPAGLTKLTYTLRGQVEPDNYSLKSLVDYINGRFLPDERSMMVALPAGAPATPKNKNVEQSLPLVHILIPFEFRAGNLNRTNSRYSYTWENINAGLDGIAIDIPPLKVKPTNGELFPLNIQIKDQIWHDRNLFDFSFSVEPGKPKTIWMDTRDRILPNGYSLYLTIAAAGADFGPASLEGAQVRLVFKDRKEAAKEHELDRFTQVKDNIANMVEEHPNIKKLKMYNRFSEDITDLFRVNPDHIPGRYYWSFKNPEQGWPPFEQPKAPADVPLWAFRQIENLKKVKQFVLWWIDERQIENGEFGGGLSDDGDMTNQWPGAALMGIEPEKITNSVLTEMEAFYENEMFTNGLSTIQTDELHAYEEGINVIPQTMLLNYADPKVVERLMKTAKAYERITGINDLGDRHILSSYFSGTKIAKESVWALAKTNHSHLILHPGLVLVEFNGHPAAKKLLLELADGLLAHRKKDKDGYFYLPAEILFPSGKDRGRQLGSVVHLFWAAWRWTNDSKYLLPIRDEISRGNYSVLNAVNANLIDLLDKRNTWGKEISSGVTPQSGSDFLRHTAWQVTGNKQFLEEYYADQIKSAAQRMYMMTEGHWWDDRVSINSNELQRARLGGIALRRSALYPGHVISWKFKKPATGENMAILVSDAAKGKITIIAYNLENEPVTAIMTAWDIEPGKWEVSEGIDIDGDDIPESITQRRTVELERTKDIEFIFQPKKTTIVNLILKSKTKPYWERPDLGIGIDDVTVSNKIIKVTVHSLGAKNAPAAEISLLDKDGETLSSASVSALKAPLDFIPKTVQVILTVPLNTQISGCRICIDPEGKLNEITKRNNIVIIP